MDALDRATLSLERALGASRVVTDPDLCAGYARDESEAETVTPRCVVRASTEDEVARALALCFEHDVPVFPRGAGTGRTGGAAVTVPGVVLDTTAMKAVVEIDRTNLLAVVEPGVVTAELQALVEREGLFYPPDPQSAQWSTLGGNVAENAGGPRALKYGVTRDWTLGMDAVLADGTVLRHGRRTRKGVAGYDTTALLVGSEGTLSVFTRLTLKLTGLQHEVVGLWALFRDVEAAGRAVSAVVGGGLVPRCVELLDAICCRVIAEADPSLGWEGAGAALVIECDGEGAERLLQRVGELCVAHGATETLMARTADEREALWSVRRTMSRALRALKKHKLSEDVVVPVGSVAALLAAVRVIAEEESVTMPTYGHAGDGNLHVNLLWDDDDAKPRVEKAIARLFRATLDLGGTLSGEHGIGTLKAPYLVWEQGPALIALQRAVKAAFDPRGILNPGKVFGPGGHRGC